MAQLLEDGLGDVKVIDADTHMTERHDLWTSRAPAALQGPRAARRARRRQARGCVDGDGPRPRRRGRRRRQARQEGPLVRRAVRVGDRAGATPPPYDPVARVRAHGRDRHLGADHLPGRRRARRAGPRRHREGRRAARRSASRSSTTRTPRSRPSRATGCCRWRSCPRGTSTRACARRNACKDLGLRGVNLTSDPQDLGAPDLASRGVGPAVGSVQLARHAGALPHRREPHDDELLRRPTRGRRTTTTPSSRSAARCCSSGTRASSSTSSAPGCSTASPS